MKISKFLSLIALALCSLTLAAQNVTTPYSMYGYGMLGDNATSTQRQMGGIGYAMNSGRQINIMNPAAYAATDSLTFLWDMGVDVSMLWSKEGQTREHSIGGGLDYMAMQFPISKFMGMSIGMLPMTSVGYSFGNQIKHGAMQNQGSGGINQAYIGVSGMYAGVSVGVNLGYAFGNIQNDVYSTPDASGNTLFEHMMQIRDWNLNIGLQYTYRINTFNRVTLGATYSPKKTFRGKTWATIQDLSSDQKPDTVAFSYMKGKYYQPNTIGVGLSYKHDRVSHFMVEADFTYQDWSKAEFSPLREEGGTVVFQGMKFDNRYKVAVGGEFTPRIRGNYLERITYRLGGYYSHDYLVIQGNNVRDYGISCGVGLPTLEGKTIINVGFEWKHRQCAPVSLVTENYFNITLGINFNELWFWQRKIK